MSRRNVLGLLGIAPRLRGGDWRNFLLRDDFTTAASAPLTSPRTAEPGPGTLTITDTNNKLSIATGKLSFATGGVGVGNPGAWGAQRVRVAGRAVVAKALASLGGIEIGWDNDQLTAVADSIRIISGSSVSLKEGGAAITADAITTSTEYSVAVILRTTGTFFAIKGGVYTNWTLMWVGVVTTANYYPALSADSSAAIGTLDTFRVLDLPAPFSTDYGLATQRLAGARSASDTFTHEANCVIEWTQTTLPSGDATRVRFRKASANEFWYIRTNAAGDIELYEATSGGTGTVRGSSAAVVSNGHRIVVVADGSTIRVYSNNVLRFTYSSASNFATATTGEVYTLGTGGAVSDIISWPRTLTGAAAAILDAAVA